MDWDELAPIISSAKDVILALAGVITAWVAVRGINKWRDEMTGKNEYDVARSLIRAAYRLRDEIRFARAPMIWAHEFKDTEDRVQGYRNVYSARFAPVAKAVEEFDTCTLEAEALWGQKIRGVTDPLRFCVGELQSAIEAFINDKVSGGEDFKADREFGKQIRAKVSDIGEKDNPLSQKIRDAVKGIEDLARPHLRHK
jgi:hypothetical protein